jgi:hypothetical protein
VFWWIIIQHQIPDIICKQNQIIWTKGFLIEIWNYFFEMSFHIQIRETDRKTQFQKVLKFIESCLACDNFSGELNYLFEMLKFCQNCLNIIYDIFQGKATICVSIRTEKLMWRIFERRLSFIKLIKCFRLNLQKKTSSSI